MAEIPGSNPGEPTFRVHPHQEHGEKFWEEVRLLESIIEDIEGKTLQERVKTINQFLNDQCEYLSPGHLKCRDLADFETVPVYESNRAHRNNEADYVGCYACNEMYRTETDPMPGEFEELRMSGVIRVGGHDYGRTVEE